ncbi:MAG: KEOPS complex subunit Pcc1 [Methanobacteriaceae archaeon]|nr:KEOPS complex subunit Pcc1 [Methanobacteriaceae archaeon]
MKLDYCGVSMDEGIINSIKNQVIIEFDSSKQAEIIYKSVLPEFETSPDYRSKMTLELDDNSLIIKINAMI